MKGQETEMKIGASRVFKFKRKIRTWTGNWTSDLQISSLALYYLSYPGSLDGTGLNLSPKSNAMQGIVVCNTICPHFTCEITLSYLFWCFFNKIDK